MCRLDARVWIEYVDSKGNWADGISREFDQDPFVIHNGVQVRRIQHPLAWYTTDIIDAWSRSKELAGHSHCDFPQK